MTVSSTDGAAHDDTCRDACLADLGAGRATVWLREPAAVPLVRADIARSAISEAEARLARFAPVLARLFPDGAWNGHIASPLLRYDTPPAEIGRLLVKADHRLPLTGTIKARGGVYEVLCFVEAVARKEGLLVAGETYDIIGTRAARRAFGAYRVGVASTGNLGLSVGMVASRFGFATEIHMSRDAKAWKKNALREMGVTVVEHDCDYARTVGIARRSFERAGKAHFIDDERSRALFVGYAVGAAELAHQLSQAAIAISAEQPLIVYLPCGVGGAPGGITFGLKSIFGRNVACVFVEPVASACMLAAIAFGEGRALPVYKLGLDNRTIADGLATPVASELALAQIGPDIDALAAVPDAAMMQWLSHAWSEAAMRLEPSAAAGFAAITPVAEALRARPVSRGPLARFDDAVHVVWTTGGSLLRDDEFMGYLSYKLNSDLTECATHAKPAKRP
ncbi:MAG: D-serine ammonia-lyase [Rhizomicrobium sp.]